MVPRKPRAASSKSLISENGSACSVASCCATTDADAFFGICFGISLGISVAVWVIRLTPLPARRSAEFQSFELAVAAPRVDVLEIGRGARGIADIELRRGAGFAALIVVVAGRAVLRADHPPRAGIAVPVPGAAEVTALFNDADVPDAGLHQPRRGGEPGKAAADEGKGDVIALRRARRDRRVGVIEIMGEPALDLEVLVVAVGTHSLVALLQILLAQPLLVDRCGLRRLVRYRHHKAPLC